MDKVVIDHRLVQRCQSISSGADVHTMNNILQRYYCHAALVNVLIDQNLLDEAEIEKNLFLDRERELRVWWAKKVKEHHDR